ncbi:hypothetical protein BaRGS_00021791 [Batillaria attramentaria]|uniref:Uncharacterized protein n=1 Tax=Batillaria attramentaria TaxID=370345 RepID=A0ABD0KIH6_9CAEN
MRRFLTLAVIFAVCMEASGTRKRPYRGRLATNHHKNEEADDLEDEELGDVRSSRYHSRLEALLRDELEYHDDDEAGKSHKFAKFVYSL